MSFQDSAVIFFIALLLFGPKKLPELARQIGKLMGEFRRASNDFRMQMEDELRISEQAERQKQIAALEAAAPSTAAEFPPAAASTEELAPHPHAALSAPAQSSSPVGMDSLPEHTIAYDVDPQPPDRSRGEAVPVEPPAPVPIATSGDLVMMPPATGLPVGRSNSGVAQAFESVPQAPSSSSSEAPTSENAHHG